MTKSQKFVAESYAKYFGRAADADTIEAYGLKENGKAEKASVILRNIIDDSDYEKIGLSTEEFVNNAFQNLFGRNATTKEMNKYSKVVDKHKDLPINSIVKKAGKFDKAVNKNKLEVAVKYADLGGKGDLDLSKISKGNTVDLNKVFTLTDLTNAIENLADNSGIPSSFDGKTFVLTTGVDTGKDFIGTNKDDLFVSADVNVNGTPTQTWSVADTLDGGKGVDTFKLYASTTNPVVDTNLPTLKNIENVVIYDNSATAVDLTKWDSVETLFLVREAAANTYTLGEKVTTVNIEDTVVANAPTLEFDDALTAATVGVNKVGTFATTAAAAAPVTVTVDSATAAGALKTLTINAYGKASNVNLTQDTADTIETLKITGRADLTLTYAEKSTSKIVTIDGSKAQGKLDLSLANTDAATLKTVKTGTGDDKLTLNIDVATGTTIDLGAGNDKLVAGTGTVVTSTTTVIDGGAGIDSLDAALVKVGNGGVFASFETISLNAATTLDLDLLTKSTITSIAKDFNAAHTLISVKKSQALTINTNITAATATVLTFKASEIAGTADAYTINFAKDAVASAGNTVDAGTVTINGIETVIVNSTGKTTTTGNLITLNDKDAKSLVITGDKALTVKFDTAFGDTTASATNGLGVSTIDASASTAGITIANLVTNLNIADAGLTIKGGAGKDIITTGATTAKALTIETGAGDDEIDLRTATTDTDKIIVNAGAGNDTITVGATGGTLTGGTGNDKFIVGDAKGGTVLTTITDIAKGDIIKGVVGTTLVKTDINGLGNLDAAITKARAADSNTEWFQFGSDTYLVINTDATSTNDVVVKLNGLFDISNSTFAAGELTIA